MRTVHGLRVSEKQAEEGHSNVQHLWMLHRSWT
jgi:hypothetical protein